jgi:hypothetical protein
MVNAWSLLFDELNMTKHSTHYYDYTRNDPDRKNPFDGDGIKIDGYSVNGVSNEDFWEEDGFSLIGNPTAAPDNINFSSTTFGAAQEVPITFGGDDVISFDLTMDEKNKLNKYKYSEDVILKELKDYITGTYNQHYSAGDDKIQTLDLIEACGDGESFCRSNILKYASRYDKKGTARRDIMKILHYAVLLMHFNDKNAQRETYPQ